MIEMVKIASSQLTRTPDYQVVKVAGILRRLKNWIKSKFDQEFQNKVTELEKDSAVHSQTLKELQEQILKVQEAIQDKELDEYKKELTSLKKLLARAFKNTSSSLTAVSELSNEIQSRFTSDLAKDTDYVDKVKKWLKEDQKFDLPLNESINISFKDVKFYSGLIPDRIKNFTESNWERGIFPSFKKENINVANVNKEKLQDNIKAAIVNGTITKVELQMPGPSDRTNAPATGVLNLSVESDFYKIPGTDYFVKTNFKIRDTSPGKFIKNPEMSVFMVGNTTLAPPSEPPAKVTASDRISILKNFENNYRINLYNSFIRSAQANLVPDEITELSDSQLAKVMEKGYIKNNGKDPILPVLAFGWAQAAHESGRNPTRLHGNNIGNIIADSKWIESGKPFFIKGHRDFSAEGELQEIKETKWKAFSTPEEGAAEYWGLLNRKYPNTLKWAAGGDPQSAVIDLATGYKYQYYTGEIDKYSSSIKSLYNTFMKNLAHNFPHLSKETIQLDESPLEIKKWRAEYETEKKSFALTALIKEALDKKSNQRSDVLIKIEGSDLTDNLEYASNLSFLIQDYLNGTTKIKEKDNKLYIEAYSYCGQNFKHGIDELSELLSKEINKKINKNVYAISAENIISFAEEINNETLSSNHRKFIIRYS
jgi:hypothetical protein